MINYHTCRYQYCESQGETFLHQGVCSLQERAQDFIDLKKLILGRILLLIFRLSQGIKIFFHLQQWYLNMFGCNSDGQGVSFVFSIGACVLAKLLQLCPILCNPMDCSLPGSSVHGFPRQEYWSGLPCLPPGDVPNPGIKPTSLMSPALAGKFFATTALEWVQQYPIVVLVLQ